VPRMRKKRNPYRIVVGNPEGKNHVQDLGEVGNAIHIVLKCGGIVRTGYIYIWASVLILKSNRMFHKSFENIPLQATNLCLLFSYRSYKYGSSAYV
jgi:hypothetical protein